VGNRRRVLVSDLSGKSNIKYKTEELGIDLDKYEDKVPEIVRQLKDLENQGYQFEAADASFELLVKEKTGSLKEYFTLEGFRVTNEKDAHGSSRSEATIRLKVNGQIEHCAAEGNGPVHALDCALRKALQQFYPEVDEMHLQDYKVRVLNEKDGTGASVRVLIDSGKTGNTWGTVGVSENILDASWQALSDSFRYFLTNQEAEQEQQKIETTV
jgi:2-isopropylmalate synthase